MEMTQRRDEETVDSVYDDFWRPILEKDGELDIEQLKKELFDFCQLIDAAEKVYCHVTGGAASNPRTDPDVICTLADDHYSEDLHEIRLLDWDGLSAETIYGHVEIYRTGGRWRWRLVDYDAVVVIDKSDVTFETQDRAKRAAFEAHKKFLLESTII